MDRFNTLTHIPINNEFLDTRLNFDDNSTNVRGLSKKKLESIDDMLLNRQQDVYKAMNIKEDINNQIIQKLDRILSKRFSLRKEDYILLIDRYGLKSSNISRKCINDMVSFLNLTSKYEEDKNSDIISESSNPFMTMNKHIDHTLSQPDYVIKQEALKNIKPDYTNRYPENSRKSVQVDENAIKYTPIKTEYNDEELPPPIQTQVPEAIVNRDKVNNDNNVKRAPVRQLVNELKNIEKVDSKENEIVNMLTDNDKLNKKIEFDKNPINFESDLEKMLKLRENIDDINLDDNHNIIDDNHNIIDNKQDNHSIEKVSNIDIAIDDNMTSNSKLEMENAIEEMLNDTNIEIENDLSREVLPVNTMDIKIEEKNNDDSIDNKNVNNNNDNVIKSRDVSKIYPPITRRKKYNNMTPRKPKSKSLSLFSIENDKNDKKNTLNDTNICIENEIISKPSIISNNKNVKEEAHNLENNTQDLNLMIAFFNKKNKNLISDIGYGDTNNITNIISIELLSCFISENLYNNNFKDYPYIILKILEIEDVLHLNGTPIGGFCYIMWEKSINNHFYSYINKDKIFGVYKTNKKFSLNKVSLQLFSPDGQGINADNLTIEKNDIFNLNLKISRRTI